MSTEDPFVAPTPEPRFSMAITDSTGCTAYTSVTVRKSDLDDWGVFTKHIVPVLLHRLHDHYERSQEDLTT